MESGYVSSLLNNYSSGAVITEATTGDPSNRGTFYLSLAEANAHLPSTGVRYLHDTCSVETNEHNRKVKSR